MKLISLACPHCNGPIQVNSELKQATCNYCGHSFLIDDETRYVNITEEDSERIGKAAEKARAEAEEISAKAAADKIKKIRGTLRKNNQLQRELVGIQKRIFDKQHYVEKKKAILSFLNRKVGKILIYGIMVLIGVMSLWSVISFDAGATGIIVGLVLIGMIGGGSKLAKIILNVVIPRDEQSLNVLIDGLQSKENEIISLQREADFDFIPEKYRNLDALQFFGDAFHDRRARTVSQAINLYEEDKHRREVLKLQREQIEIQKKQYEMEQKRATAAIEAAEEAAEEREEEAAADRRQRMLETAVTAGAVVKAGSTIAKAIKSLK